MIKFDFIPKRDISPGLGQYVESMEADQDITTIVPKLSISSRWLSGPLTEAAKCSNYNLPRYGQLAWVEPTGPGGSHWCWQNHNYESMACCCCQYGTGGNLNDVDKVGLQLLTSKQTITSANFFAQDPSQPRNPRHWLESRLAAAFLDWWTKSIKWSIFSSCKPRARSR